jgi:hypothetical protein
VPCLSPRPHLHLFTLDLIRHGKNHHHARHEHKHADDDELSPSSPIGFHRHQQQGQKQPMQHIVPEHLISPPPQDVAAMIVQEEREAKLKMPIYRGLENFNILEKMGECVDASFYQRDCCNRQGHPAVPFPTSTRLSNHHQA